MDTGEPLSKHHYMICLEEKLCPGYCLQNISKHHTKQPKSA